MFKVKSVKFLLSAVAGVILCVLCFWQVDTYLKKQDWKIIKNAHKAVTAVGYYYGANKMLPTDFNTLVEFLEQFHPKAEDHYGESILEYPYKDHITYHKVDDDHFDLCVDFYHGIIDENPPSPFAYDPPRDKLVSVLFLYSEYTHSFLNNYCFPIHARVFDWPGYADRDTVVSLRLEDYPKIKEYYLKNGKMPENEANVNREQNCKSYIDREDVIRTNCVYKKIDEQTFQLCEEFHTDNKESKRILKEEGFGDTSFWKHPKGKHCFDFSVNDF